MSSEPAKPKIVVIDDDDAFLRLMEDLLGSEGYDVRTRQAWLQAYEFVKAERPDLVILDVVLGGEDRGWSVLDLLLLDPETRPVPVIICSASLAALRERAEILQRHGILALAKPFDLDDLLNAIELAFAGRPERPGRRGTPDGCPGASPTNDGQLEDGRPDGAKLQTRAADG